MADAVHIGQAAKLSDKKIALGAPKHMNDLVAERIAEGGHPVERFTTGRVVQVVGWLRPLGGA